MSTKHYSHSQLHESHKIYRSFTWLVKPDDANLLRHHIIHLVLLPLIHQHIPGLFPTKSLYEERGKRKWYSRFSSSFGKCCSFLLPKSVARHMIEISRLKKCVAYFYLRLIVDFSHKSLFTYGARWPDLT